MGELGFLGVGYIFSGGVSKCRQAGTRAVLCITLFRPRGGGVGPICSERVTFGGWALLKVHSRVSYHCMFHPYPQCTLRGY